MDGCARTIEWLRERVPVEMIRDISLADYGRDAEEHFAGIMDLVLRRTWVNGVPPGCPWEVLELEVSEEKDHLRRLFVCSLLVACAGYERANEYFVECRISTLIRLTESAIAVGGEAPGLTLEMLTWFSEQHKQPDVYPFTCFCIARLRLHMGMGDAAALRGWVNAEEARAAEELGVEWLWGGEWLSRLSVYAENDCEKWAWAS